MNSILSLEQMNTKEQQLQISFLNTLRKEHIQVALFLKNGIKLQGQIESFDNFMITLKSTFSQVVYKHAILTILPARSVTIPPVDLVSLDTE